jgi:multicomponent Na+:H+ antiporter subunit C
MEAFGLYNYWIVIFLMMSGFYVVIARGNLVKKLVGLNIFQASVFVLPRLSPRASKAIPIRFPMS